MKHTTALTILHHALPDIAFDGWSERALKAGMRSAGVPEDQYIRFFPNGPIDALNMFLREADLHMVQKYRELPAPPARIRDKVAMLIRLRLEAYATYREAVRRGLALYSMPLHAHHGVSALAKTVDTIWKTLGDTSADFNWYTKRILLSGVYMSTLIYWLSDESEGFKDTWAFLDRRIDNVMQIEKWKGKLGMGKKRA